MRRNEKKRLLLYIIILKQKIHPLSTKIVLSAEDRFRQHFYGCTSFSYF